MTDCQKAAFRRGWCNMHYTRWLRYGDVNVAQKPAPPKKSCLIDDCTGDAYKRGWCNKHYQRWRMLGSPTATLGRDVTPEQRFWPKVNKDGPVPAHRPELGPCWLWKVSRTEGYGSFRVNGKFVGAHRFAYQMLVGPTPPGLELDHLCRVRHCVNPAHLEPVTHKINALRGMGVPARNARKTRCKRGHKFTPENTFVDARGSRVCRQCNRERRWVANPQRPTRERVRTGD